MHDFDSFDIALLATLQNHGRMASVALAEHVHLSPSQVTRRMHRLEESGAIRRYGALLRPGAIGLHVLAFTSVSLDIQTAATTAEFRDAIADLPQVLECFATTGDADFLLKIATTDLAAFSDLLMTRIMPIAHVRNVRSAIVLGEFKNATAYDLSHLRQV
jgi:Lrp/AsnC family transcriptional regulator, leucine-responsive regulatory protein